MIYILRRLKGLKQLKSVNDIKAYYSNTENGQAVADEFYKENHLPGATTSLGLPWDDLAGKFCFAGTQEDLDQIVKSLKLKYEDGENKGKVIDKANLDDINDPFFDHSYFYGRFLAKEGQIILDDSLPDQKLLVLSLKANRKVVDKTKETYYSVGAEWELLSPAQEEQYTSESNDIKLKAYNMLEEKTQDSLDMIAYILNVNYDEKIPGSAKNKMFEAIEKNSKLKEFGVKFVDKFMELASKGKDELIPMYNVRRGEKNGLLYFNGSYYQFKAASNSAETTINVRTFTELVNYFDKNPEQLKILITENSSR